MNKFYICLDEKEYELSLVKGKVYKALDDPDAEEMRMIRIVDETGEDYLFPAERFAPIQLPQDVARQLSLTA
jgi:hypothetical protein